MENAAFVRNLKRKVLSHNRGVLPTEQLGSDMKTTAMEFYKNHVRHSGAVSSPLVLGRFFCPQVLLPFFEDLKTSKTLHVMKPPKSVPGFKAPVFPPWGLIALFG